ncbi:hypothetical protein BC477_15195 [Clavibacter michiganensis subsp. michiganensis]|uniref:Uncharacterized protein n=1 Tax=Clavibacter michiganensis subsp. michiganensis TaxID=33013 RepID=A0A251XD77_CLAMM|nr:hypothetical protein BC477_15195 [Clavibacter michiganensis subsp. michiganensis]OUD99815.1 hypothetical protein CMMCAS07_20285 [Clavibacter michiganensis subsp. michiganensis]
MTTTERITMARSTRPSSPNHPNAPAYTPRGPPSSACRMPTAADLGAPVMDPAGNRARTASTAETPGASSPSTRLTSWCTWA